MITIGMVIGDRYEVLEKIGTGGMSDVYKAKDNKLNRYVAIKVLKSEFSENTNFVSKFRVEAQAAARLTHPNIVNVYDVGEEGDTHYIVMELVEGITLKNYIEKKARLSVKEAISIAIQVSMGIEAAHNNHIIHRDIKPQNIMISKEGKVKIADFGIAKAATSNTITSNVMGSVHYTSPEQARGGFSDERSDIYSLGCTMYEMLTGRVPFDGETTVAIAIRHIQEEMPSPREFVSEIPVCVEQIIFKCTQKSPDRRYQSVSELIVDLKKSLITPNENFVKIIDADTGGATKTISEEDLEQIKRQTGNIYLGKVTEAEEPQSWEEEEVEEIEEEEIPQEYETEEEPEEDDEEELRRQRAAQRRRQMQLQRQREERERQNRKARAKKQRLDDDFEDEEDKMEKVTTVLAIVAAVIIGILALLILANITGLIGGKKDKDEDGIEGSILEDTLSQEEGDLMPDDAVVMINVVGKDLDTAKAELAAIELGIKATEQESEQFEKGIVISQDIAEGASVAKNSTINLIVSSGSSDKADITVVDVVGKTEADAKKALEDLGLVVEATTDNSDTVEAGKVISQAPTAGDKVEKGATVRLIVSAGVKEEKVTVPDLRGMSEAAAKEKLTASGLAVGSVSTVNSDTVTAGCVVSQSSEPGAEVKKGSSVNIQLSVGPKAHTYKYVASLNAPTGYTAGEVTITIKDANGTTKSFTTTTFPCAVNETGFTAATGTLTYTYKKKDTQTVMNPETGEEYEEEIETDVTSNPVSVQFTEE
ncbi:MAG: Stk1 family PASTA domain-containing Ser/Thr kinase [Lachnospiraceae bacterium]|nr:Stk1 family PASTA domain-containing Ser/Thr kinase [Lachnospiraceae bacterium]